MVRGCCLVLINAGLRANKARPRLCACVCVCVCACVGLSLSLSLWLRLSLALPRPLPSFVSVFPRRSQPWYVCQCVLS